MIRIFFLTFLILSCSGCKWFSNAGSPFFKWSNFKTPAGTPAFQEGWRHGCGTSTYARSNIWYRTWHKHEYNPQMIGNPEYRFGYGRGYSWCFQNALSGIGGAHASFDRAINPYGYDSTFSGSNVNKAWGGMFDGILNQNSMNSGNGLDGIFDVWQKSVGDSGQGGNRGGYGGKTAFGTILWEGGSGCQFFGQADC